MSFEIFTDSASNLPAEFERENNIHELAYVFTFNGQEHRCLSTDVFDGHEFYESMRHGTIVTTSQINPQNYVDAWRVYLEQGQDILQISMSSGISGSYNSACIAREEICDSFPDRKIVVIDTLSASMAEGLIVYRAKEMRDMGCSLEEIEKELLIMRKHITQVFTVDELKYLRRTGRISNAAAIVGTVLQVKPLLKGNELGQIVTFDKVRGRRKSIEGLAAKYDELIINHESARIGIAHADCEEDADYLISLLNRNKPPKEIIKVMYDPCTGSHVGPGTLALFFVGVEDARSR